MEAQFIELISDEELEKLREAVKLTKELVELQEKIKK